MVIRLSGLKYNKADDTDQKDAMTFSGIEIYSKKEAISNYKNEEACNRWDNKENEVVELMKKVFKKKNEKLEEKHSELEGMRRRLMSDNTKSGQDSIGSGSESMHPQIAEGPLVENRKKGGKYRSCTEVIKEVNEKSGDSSDEEEKLIHPSSANNKDLDKLSSTQHRFKSYKEGRFEFDFEFGKKNSKKAEKSTELEISNTTTKNLRRAKTTKDKQIASIKSSSNINNDDLINDEGNSENIKSYVSNYKLASQVLSSDKTKEEMREQGFINPKEIEEDQVSFSHSKEDMCESRSDKEGISFMLTKIDCQENPKKLEEAKQIGRSNTYKRPTTNAWGKKLRNRKNTKSPIRRFEMKKTLNIEDDNKRIKLINDPKYGDIVNIQQDKQTEDEFALREYFCKRQTKKGKGESKFFDTTNKTEEDKSIGTNSFN